MKNVVTVQQRESQGIQIGKGSIIKSLEDSNEIWDGAAQEQPKLKQQVTLERSPTKRCSQENLQSFNQIDMGQFADRKVNSNASSVAVDVRSRSPNLIDYNSAPDSQTHGLEVIFVKKKTQESEENATVVLPNASIKNSQEFRKISDSIVRLSQEREKENQQTRNVQGSNFIYLQNYGPDPQLIGAEYFMNQDSAIQMTPFRGVEGRRSPFADEGQNITQRLTSSDIKSSGRVTTQKNSPHNRKRSHKKNEFKQIVVEVTNKFAPQHTRKSSPKKKPPRDRTEASPFDQPMLLGVKALHRNSSGHNGSQVSPKFPMSQIIQQEQSRRNTSLYKKADTLKQADTGPQLDAITQSAGQSQLGLVPFTPNHAPSINTLTNETKERPDHDATALDIIQAANGSASFQIDDDQPQKFVSGEQKLLNDLLTQQMNYKSLQKFDVDSSHIISPAQPGSERVSGRVSTQPMKPTNVTVTTKVAEPNVNKIQTNIKYYHEAVQKKYSTMHSNARPLLPVKGKILSDKIDYEKAVEKKRQEEEAGRKYMQGWAKKHEQDYLMKTRSARSRAQTQRAQQRNQISKQNPKLEQPVVSRNSQRPGTEVIAEVKSKPIGAFFVRRVDSRAQSAHIDKNQQPAPQQPKPRVLATLDASILNVKPLESRRFDQLSPTEKSDTHQLKSKYQNSDLNTLMLKGPLGKSTLMDKKRIRSPSTVSIKSQKSRSKSRDFRKSEMEMVKKSQESKKSERIDSKVRDSDIFYKTLHQTDMHLKLRDLDPSQFPQHNEQQSSTNKLSQNTDQATRGKHVKILLVERRSLSQANSQLQTLAEKTETGQAEQVRGNFIPYDERMRMKNQIQEKPLFLSYSRKGCGFDLNKSGSLINNRITAANKVLKLSIDETVKHMAGSRGLKKERMKAMRTQEFKQADKVFKIAPTLPEKLQDQQMMGWQYATVNSDLPVCQSSVHIETQLCKIALEQATMTSGGVQFRSPKQLMRLAQQQELYQYLTQRQKKYIPIQSAVATIHTQDSARNKKSASPNRVSKRQQTVLQQQASAKTQVHENEHASESSKMQNQHMQSSKGIDKQSFSMALNSPIDCGPVNEIEQILAVQASFQKLHQLTSEVQLLDLDPKMIGNEIAIDEGQEVGVDFVNGTASDGVQVEHEGLNTLRPFSEKQSQEESEHPGIQKKKSKVIFSVKKNGESQQNITNFRQGSFNSAKVEENNQPKSQIRIEKRCSSIASHSESGDEKIQEFMDPRNQKNRFSAMKKTPTLPVDLKEDQRLQELRAAALDSPAAASGKVASQPNQIVRKVDSGSSSHIQEEGSEQSKPLGENMKLEVDLKEQIKLHSVELDTENNTVFDQTLINMKAQTTNISGVHIRLQNEVSNIFDAKFVKRAKTEMLLRPHSNLGSQNQKTKENYSARRNRKMSHPVGERRRSITAVVQHDQGQSKQKKTKPAIKSDTAKVKVEQKSGPNSPNITFDKRNMKDISKKSSNKIKVGISPEPVQQPSIQALLFMKTAQQALSPTNNYRDVLPAKVITMQLPDQNSVKEARTGFSPHNTKSVAQRVPKKDQQSYHRQTAKNDKDKQPELQKLLQMQLGDTDIQVQVANQSSRESFFTEGSEEARTLTTPLSQESDGHRQKQSGLTSKGQKNVRQIQLIQRPESIQDTLTQKRNSGSAMAHIHQKVTANSSDIKHVIVNNQESTEESQAFPKAIHIQAGPQRETAEIPFCNDQKSDPSPGGLNDTTLPTPVILNARLNDNQKQDSPPVSARRKSNLLKNYQKDKRKILVQQTTLEYGKQVDADLIGNNVAQSTNKRMPTRGDWSAPRMSIRDANDRKSADRNISYDQLETRQQQESDAPETEKKFRQSISTTTYELRKQASVKNTTENSNMKQLFSLSNMNNLEYEKQTATVENLNEKKLTPVSSVNLISTINQANIEIINNSQPKEVQVKTTSTARQSQQKPQLMQLKKKFSANPNQCPPKMYPSKSEPKSKVIKSKRKKETDPIVVEVHAHPNFSPIMPAQLISRDELMSDENTYLSEGNRTGQGNTIDNDDCRKSNRGKEVRSPQYGQSTVGSSISRPQPYQKSGYTVGQQAQEATSANLDPIQARKQERAREKELDRTLNKFVQKRPKSTHFNSRVQNMKKFYQARHGRNLTGNMPQQKTVGDLTPALDLNHHLSETHPQIQSKAQITHAGHSRKQMIINMQTILPIKSLGQIDETDQSFTLVGKRAPTSTGKEGPESRKRSVANATSTMLEDHVVQKHFSVHLAQNNHFASIPRVVSGNEGEVNKNVLQNDDSLEQGSRFFERRQTPLHVPKLPENQNRQVQRQIVINSSIDTREDAIGQGPGILQIAQTKEVKKKEPGYMSKKGGASRQSKQRNLSKKSSSIHNTKASQHAVDKQHLFVATKNDAQNRVKDLFMDAEMSATTGKPMNTMLGPSETFFEDETLTPGGALKQQRYPVISHTAGTSPSN